MIWLYNIMLWVMYVVLIVGIIGLVYFIRKIKHNDAEIDNSKLDNSEVLGVVTISIFEYKKLKQDSRNLEEVRSLILGNNISTVSRADENPGKMVKISESSESI